ncbi:MAG: hypothetical protein H6706_21840 [Myxococcales bacterium]|nr:hypothetical protein [Myxococcales bacterium]
MAWRLLGALLALVLVAGCDDDGGDGGGGGAGGAGGGGPAADMGVVQGASETFTFTELALEQPAALAGLLTTLLNNNLNAGAIIILVQIDGWGGNGALILRGGAGQQVAGADTPADFSDDGFTWLTEGECANADGTTTPCSVDISERAGTQTGEDFSMSGGEIFIYSEDLKIIIPIRGLALTGTRDGDFIDARLDGVITDADAAEVRFKLNPAAEMTTDLKSLLSGARVMPTETLDGQPAYAFSGTFSAELVTFVAP